MRPLKKTAHRPWPLPSEPYIMKQHWLDLLFMHWRVPVSLIRQMVPAALEIDTYEGETYIGLVPFRMSRIHPRYLPFLPWISAFPEFNVRVYVKHGEKAGVWFFSLEAANPVAVWIARRFYHLPYFNATMQCAPPNGDRIAYTSIRTHKNAPPTEFRASYAPTGPAYKALPGTLEHWLTERYCLYSMNGAGELLRGEIHHVPWGLQPAECHVETNTLAAAHGITLPDEAPILHFVRRLEVFIWRVRRVSETN